MTSSKCNLPPAGWSCSRDSGHSGPCAAEPLSTSVQAHHPLTKLSDDEAKAMLERLSTHFGEPVMPVTQYCAALQLWGVALREKADRLEAVSVDKPTNSAATDAVYARDFHNNVALIFMQMMKSNLLHRLIYQGESLRTVMCPVHKGIWSGCYWAEKDNANCACQRSQDGHIGSNVTGWLP